MEVLKTILMIAFIIICLAIIVIILMQEGKSGGLGSLSGQTSETYWSKNKGHSRAVSYTHLFFWWFHWIDSIKASPTD